MFSFVNSRSSLAFDYLLLNGTELHHVKHINTFCKRVDYDNSELIIIIRKVRDWMQIKS